MYRKLQEGRNLGGYGGYVIKTACCLYQLAVSSYSLPVCASVLCLPVAVRSYSLAVSTSVLFLRVALSSYSLPVSTSVLLLSADLSSYSLPVILADRGMFS